MDDGSRAGRQVKVYRAVPAPTAKCKLGNLGLTVRPISRRRLNRSDGRPHTCRHSAPIYFLQNAQCQNVKYLSHCKMNNSNQMSMLFLLTNCKTTIKTLINAMHRAERFFSFPRNVIDNK